MADVMDIRDGICAYLQGGIGNQLFILATAWEQAERLNCPLYIDTSRFLAADPIEFSHDTPRTFDLATMELPGTVMGEESPWYKNSPRRPVPIRRFARRSHQLRVYKQRAFGFHPSIDDITIGTTLLGFFQSPKYFSTVGSRVLTLLRNMPITDLEKTALEQLAMKDAITVHMRRGDYLLGATASHHGIASAAYVARAISLFEELAPGIGFRVFSDSPDVARQEMEGKGNLDFLDEPNALSSVATLIAMASGQGIIMSNSSFSWWAAWMMSQDEHRHVIAPRPWVASGESASDLLLPDWIALDAR